MKQEQMQDALSLIDDKYINEVEKLRRTKKKKRNLLTKGIAVAACFCIAFTTVFFAYHDNDVKAEDLMSGIVPNVIETEEPRDANDIATDFAVRLLNASVNEGENTLVSPLSVLCALSMTANGADGETKAQMESALGMSVEELNGYIYNYINSLPQGEKYKLNIANSIWFKDSPSLSVNRDFLQTNADYYGASIYKAPFDEETLKDINSWVEEKTDGMIPEILDEISEEAIMYLVNALAFEAEWQEVYFEHQVREGKFTLEDKSTVNAEFMYSDERLYIETENASGFIKRYNGGKYAFAALLPNEDITVSQLIDTLRGDKLNETLSNPKLCAVKAKIPKFETEFSTELSEALRSMGINDAFDGGLADFSKLGTSANGNIYISRVLHKTFISVGEKGTKAGAATVVEMNCEGIEILDSVKEVYLDRPFVYMLIDCETNTPFFIGTMMNPNA